MADTKTKSKSTKLSPKEKKAVAAAAARRARMQWWILGGGLAAAVILTIVLISVFTEGEIPSINTHSGL